MATRILSFLILWWLIFMILIPCWVQVDSNPKKGHADSAPNRTFLGKKAFLSTVITVVLYIIVWYVIDKTEFSLRAFFTS